MPIRKSKPHPRFGATKAQGKRYQELRALKNRIHELEVIECRLQGRLAEQQGRIDILEKAIDLLNGPPRAAITRLIHMAVSDINRLGMLGPVQELDNWLRDVELAEAEYAKLGVSSGK